MRLWEKGISIDQKILAFTVGEDPRLDQALIVYDCRASKAHARMLGAAGILTGEEVDALCRVLEEIAALAREGRFSIDTVHEDVHTAIEHYLTQKLGDTGKKIHTARSRNDQVVTALRLFYRDRLWGVEKRMQGFLKGLAEFSQRYGETPLPGYSHTRKAMPTTIKVWVGAFQAALEDDLFLLQALQSLLDRCPAGTGAGYGVPLAVDREFLARELGFSRIQENPLHVQNSRGPLEGNLLHLLSNIQLTLNRLAGDLIFFTLPELGFFELPEALTTGSSIMPQKKNPDVLELIRGYAHRLLSLEMEVRTLSTNLISGYHRDLQLTKGPVLQAFPIVEQSLEVMAHLCQNLRVRPENCRRAMTPELYATEQVYRLVKQGIPFREAYRRIAQQFREEPET